MQIDFSLISSMASMLQLNQKLIADTALYLSLSTVCALIPCAESSKFDLGMCRRIADDLRLCLLQLLLNANMKLGQGCELSLPLRRWP